MTTANLQISRSGNNFDLKFLEPFEHLHSTLLNFLKSRNQSNLIANNSSAIKEGVLILIGYESRTDSTKQNTKLIESIKSFCSENKIKYSQSTLPLAGEESDEVALKHTN